MTYFAQLIRGTVFYKRALWGANTFPARNRLPNPFLVSQIITFWVFQCFSHKKIILVATLFFTNKSLFQRRPAATPVATDGDSAGDNRESSLTNQLCKILAFSLFVLPHLLLFPFSLFVYSYHLSCIYLLCA